ncbi:TPA: hypothetical protein ACH3X2_006791 [Trebouxia sp. C0005]
MLTLLLGCSSPSLNGQKVVMGSCQNIGSPAEGHELPYQRQIQSRISISISKENTTRLKAHNLRLYDQEYSLEATHCLHKKVFRKIIVGMPILTLVRISFKASTSKHTCLFDVVFLT